MLKHISLRNYAGNIPLLKIATDETRRFRMFQILLSISFLLLRVSLSLQRTVQHFGAHHVLALHTGEYLYLRPKYVDGHL